MKIGLISDTHNFLDPAVSHYFDQVDEIWHAGDFGSYEVAEELSALAPVIGVYGNIDGQDIRKEFPLHQRFVRNGLNIWMTHIGGVPGRYCIPVRDELSKNPPDVFVCGHSHILKIARDQEHSQMIYLNPGAAGKQGFQTVRTILRFSISDASIRDMEVIELS